MHEQYQVHLEELSHRVFKANAEIKHDQSNHRKQEHQRHVCHRFWKVVWQRCVHLVSLFSEETGSFMLKHHNRVSIKPKELVDGNIKAQRINLKSRIEKLSCLNSFACCRNNFPFESIFVIYPDIIKDHGDNSCHDYISEHLGFELFRIPFDSYSVSVVKSFKLSAHAGVCSVCWFNIWHL